MTAQQLHRLFVRVAFSGAHVFAWISALSFLYAQSFSLQSAFAGVVLTYALTHVIGVLMTPVAARNMRHGARRTMIFGILSAASAFAALGFGYLPHTGGIAWSVTVFAILLGVYRALYFIPYAVEARSVPRIAYLEVLIALMPILAGIVVSRFTHMPEWLFFAAAIVLVLSIVPAMRMSRRPEGFAWGYRQTFHELFDARHRTILLSAICDGIEGAALLFIWPLSVWLVLGGSYFLLGIVVSISLLCGLVIRAILRHYRVEPSPLVASTIVISAWIFRIVAGSAAAIVFVDTYSGAAGSSHKRGMDIASHEQAADNHTYIDEFTALKEMGNGLGRVLLCLLVVALIPTGSLGIVLTASFLIAACAGAFSIFLTRSHGRVAF